MAADPHEIALFDFISHETMHLPFNEEYLRVLRAAFPSDRIVFHARAGHVANLKPRVADLGGIAFEACEALTPPFGLSEPQSARRPGWQHKTAAGRWPTRSAGTALRLAALLGVDGNLYAVIGQHWPKVSPAPLHMILHGQLGDAMIWRSRNPLARAFDIASQIQRPLPAVGQAAGA